METEKKRGDWRRATGILMMILGAAVLFMPIMIGGWIIGLLGLVLVVLGIIQFIIALRPADRNPSYVQYLAAILTIALGAAMFLSPNTALYGLIVIISLLLVFDGLVALYGTYKQTGAERWWSLFNGFFAIALGLLIWFLLTAQLGLIAVSLVMGLYLLAQGWTMFFLPGKDAESFEHEWAPLAHPDTELGIAPSDAVREMREEIVADDLSGASEVVKACLKFLAIFFVIHALRTDARWSFIGLIAPFVAVVGDALVAILLGAVFVIPLQIIWRRISRPVERVAWLRFTFLREKERAPTLGERALKFWLKHRMAAALEIRRVRYSLNFAFWHVMRVGLPATAVLIAVNSIWGFSWYFNSENWASGVYQEIAKGRVDAWRSRMTAEAAAQAVAAGVSPESVFEVRPAEVPDSGDFSFIVIGDTGEGDQSQMSLRPQILGAGAREEVKFLVVSSDVVYPDGRMKDYENNFYLPFMGFQKPVYAIPGNHDWYDANEGFNANFLSRDAAVAALRGRLAEDLKTELITTDARFDEITQEAQRLREYYGVKNGLQRGPYFELHAPGFSLIAVDTGILRRIDDRQKEWLEAALTKAEGNFKVVVLGHPLYVAGRHVGANNEDIASIGEMLRRHHVDVVMAGDTHDFELYKELYVDSDGQRRGTLNLVNGGGGAYLSVGTAMAFPADPDVSDYAYYPRTDDLRNKLLAETPFWRMPFYYWMDWFGGYPFDSEVVSGAFDFNRAPFFQSFVEVRVERSTGLVRLQLHGAHGRLRWRDIQTAGTARPPGTRDDDAVEFVAPIRGTADERTARNALVGNTSPRFDGRKASQ
jgi:uncharacterized membrane protein HdeD (DUF308 family)/3',5'-cyclic AMP phosphodiesterase CpdA